MFCVHLAERLSLPVMLVSSITSLLAMAGHSALFQAGAIILATFILEDAATVAAAMQVQDGDLSVWVALVSLYAGIVLGDLGLYGLGRLSACVPWVARQLPPPMPAHAGTNLKMPALSIGKHNRGTSIFSSAYLMMLSSAKS